MKHIIIGNFGNHSLAVLQTLIDRALSQVHFLYVETGWAASSWPARVFACSEYAKKHGIKVHQLIAKASMSEMVLDRKQFPNQKFQWCASFLKGLTITHYLDEIDPHCEALIISGKRREDSRRYANLSEFEEDNELFLGRTIWHPLWQTKNNEFIALIKKTGFPLIAQQSLECSPCIHANENSLAQLDDVSIQRLDHLEKKLGQTMFQQAIKFYCAKAKEEPGGLSLQQFDRGCGSPWGCGE